MTKYRNSGLKSVGCLPATLTKSSQISWFCLIRALKINENTVEVNQIFNDGKTTYFFNDQKIQRALIFLALQTSENQHAESIICTCKPWTYTNMI